MPATNEAPRVAQMISHCTRGVIKATVVWVPLKTAVFVYCANVTGVDESLHAAAVVAVKSNISVPVEAGAVMMVIVLSPARGAGEKDCPIAIKGTE